jgi:hypothetical protein
MSRGDTNATTLSQTSLTSGNRKMRTAVIKLASKIAISRGRIEISNEA